MSHVLKKGTEYSIQCFVDKDRLICIERTIIFTQNLWNKKCNLTAHKYGITSTDE
jgi:hypothetical protein